MKKFFQIMLITAILTLCLSPVSQASVYDPIDLTGDQAAAANLFLSNFTETGVRELDVYGEDLPLVDFAHDHLWFNDHDAYEYGEYGAGNNCRVSDERIQEIVDKYFYDPRPVDLSQTRFDYIDGYYYHCETGGWTPNGFAHVISACQIEADTYFLSFLVFGDGEHWDNGVMNDSLDEIAEAFAYPSGYGSALIHADDLADRSTYRLISLSML